MNWQLQEAKQRFSELVRRALEEGPQVITRHGMEVVVVVPAQDYRRSSLAEAPDLAAFLLSGPDFDLLDLERTGRLPRTVNLSV